MEVIFEEDESYPGKKYGRRNDPHDHPVGCQTAWELSPTEEWVPVFVHMLEGKHANGMLLHNCEGKLQHGNK